MVLRKIYSTVQYAKYNITFHNRKQRGRDRGEETDGRDKEEEIEGKIQKRRDGGEETG
jgi:hypothetical protein